MIPLRILFISNSSILHCGVAEFGRQNARTLRELGHTVVEWDGSYPTVYERGSYFPDNWATYDVLHLNWQPSTLNHYVPEVIPPHPLISIFLHDIPPHSTCSAVGRARVLFTFESSADHPQATVIPPPMVDYTPKQPRNPTPMVGRTGIRDASRTWLQTLCAKHGWEFNSEFTEWVPIEAELDRLARSWVNVVWYEENRSRSTSAVAAAFAGRPLLLSRSERFQHLLPWADTIYWGDYPELEKKLLGVMDDVTHGVARVPASALRAGCSWQFWAGVMAATWSAACSR